MHSGILGVALLAMLALAACGGGNDSPANGSEQRITNPAAVPSAEPISEDGAIVYRITDNGILAPSGQSTPTNGGTGNGNTGGGNGGYTVVSGDTCGSIAAQFNLTSQQIIDANPAINENCTNLQPGQQLTIPGTSTGGGTGGSGDDDGDGDSGGNPDPTPTPGGQTYEVVDGDSCSVIAAGYGVTVEALQAANPSLDCGNLQIGTVVLIP